MHFYRYYVFLSSLQGTSEALEEVGGMLVEKLPVFIQSGDLEVQERACCILQVSHLPTYYLAHTSCCPSIRYQEYS